MDSTTSKAVDRFPKLHSPLFISSFDPESLSYRVEKTREQMTIKDENGEDKELAEKWELVAYYRYSDGKVDRLNVEYDALPCYIMIDRSNPNFGVKRKIYAKISKERLVYRSTVKLRDGLRAAFIETVLEIDCSKVFPSWKVSVVCGKKSLEISYSMFIAAKLAGADKIKPGAKSKEEVPLADVEAAFREKLEGSDDVETVVRTRDILSEMEGKAPTKFMDISGYPKTAKSTKAEDIAKFETAKVEGSRKLTVFASKDLRGRLLHERLLPEDAWILNKDGQSHRTTDYHIMTHIPKGQTPVLSFAFTYTWKQSISREGEFHIDLKENVQQGALIDIRPSDFVPRSNAAEDAYKQEYANGEPSHQNHDNALSRLASAEIPEGQETYTD